MLLPSKVSLLAAALFAAATADVRAQKLPLPGQINPDWTLQKTEELSPKAPVAELPQPTPSPMPNMQLQGGTLNAVGEWEIFYDSRQNVRYNLAALRQGAVRVQHLQTGTVYTYIRKGVVAPYFQE